MEMKAQENLRRGTGGLLLAIGAFGAALLAATPCRGQEQVRIQVPERVVFQVLKAQAKSDAAPTRLTFDHAILAPGNRLRVSVRAERLDLASPGAPPRIFFTSRSARGGTGLSGPLRETDFTPVFEGDPFALSGALEVAWALEPFAPGGGPQVYPVSLRWKVESVPGGSEPGLGSPAASDPAAELSPCSGTEICRPSLADPFTDTRRGRLRPPG
jgi:hypothetical protein